MQARNESRVNVSDCSGHQRGIGGAWGNKGIGDRRIPKCFGLLKSSRGISGPYMPLKHPMPHKLEVGANKTHLDLIRKCVPNYILCIHFCRWGQGARAKILNNLE